MRQILKAADSLANHKNYWIARAWERYRPMIYLAADSGMRPQEYLVCQLPIFWNEASELHKHSTEATKSDHQNHVRVAALFLSARTP